MAAPKVVVAIRTFVCEVKGQQHIVRKGERLAAGHPAVKARRRRSSPRRAPGPARVSGEHGPPVLLPAALALGRWARCPSGATGLLPMAGGGAGGAPRPRRQNHTPAPHREKIRCRGAPPTRRDAQGAETPPCRSGRVAASLAPLCGIVALRTVQGAGRVSTGVVVVIVAIAVVLVVLIVALSIRGRQRRKEQQRRADRRDLREAEQRVGRAERDADIAREEADRRGDPDR
jgi:uncharacterized membrane protein